MLIIEVGNKLREVRARHNVKQSDLAKYLEISERTYIFKEGCKTEFKQSEMARIVYYFNSTFNTLYTESDIFYTNIKATGIITL